MCEVLLTGYVVLVHPTLAGSIEVGGLAPLEGQLLSVGHPEPWHAVVGFLLHSMLRSVIAHLLSSS